MKLPDLDEVMKAMMKEQAERMRSEIFGQIFPPFDSGRYYPSQLIIERPKGSVDLLSPEGEVLMRDGKLVDKIKDAK